MLDRYQVRDKSVKIWDFKINKSIYTLQEHNAGVTSVAVGPRVVGIGICGRCNLDLEYAHREV
jgi:WD40 repeat protein